MSPYVEDDVITSLYRRRENYEKVCGGYSVFSFINPDRL